MYQTPVQKNESCLQRLLKGHKTWSAFFQDLLRSALPDSMESALGGDERCVLDTMRLVDLLLVLLFEGRKALPKSTAGSTSRIPGLRRLDSSGERSHRQLIDCIRSKDTDALIDAIDTGGMNTLKQTKSLFFFCPYVNVFFLIL